MDNQDTIDELNTLIETCKDGEFGFRSCAEHASTAALRSTFEHRAEECRKGAAELDQLVVALGGEPETSGSTAGAMHRGWVSVKGQLAGYNDVAMLEECERGEDAALERYRKALQCDLSPATRGVVARQFEGVERNHAQIRALRDEARAVVS